MKKLIILSASIFFFVTPILAWPGGSGSSSPTGGGPGFNNAIDDSTPVDGGIVTVTALAIGYGVRQARKRKEDKNNENGAV